MDERKVLNYCGQAIDLAHTIKKQPPGQRYGHADGIITLIHAIRAEVRGEGYYNARREPHGTARG